MRIYARRPGTTTAAERAVGPSRFARPARPFEIPPPVPAAAASPARAAAPVFGPVIQCAHRKYDNPRRGQTGFINPRTRKPFRRREEVDLQQAERMGIPVISSPQGDKFLTRGQDPIPQKQRTQEERQDVASRISRRITERAARDRRTSPVTVAHRDDAFGTGAFWDHYTLQSSTGRPTVASHHPDVAPQIQPYDQKANKGHNYRGGLPMGNPGTVTNAGTGLLFIPGGNYGLDSEQPSRDPAHVPSGSATARHQRRVTHDRALLRQAQRTGRPVLSVCGGSWRTLESCGGSTRRVHPKTHQTRQMPYLKKDGSVAQVASEHDVTIDPDSMLGGIMDPRPRGQRQQKIQKVNTAHWAVAEETSAGGLKGVPSPNRHALLRRLPNGQMLRITGPSDPRNQLLTVSARGGSPNPYMRATEPRPQRSVEAFESRYGAPVLGVQWHPEAYDRGAPTNERIANQRILNAMAQAGDAYDARRGMTGQFEEIRAAAATGPNSISPSRIKALMAQREEERL
jgi:gamma-glutamyl-gamma-aminobutyrate hydrolase PuuD